MKESIQYSLDIHTVSELNERCHWAERARRAKRQRSSSMVYTLSAIRSNEKIERKIGSARFVLVTLTRRAPKTMDSDNLASAMKHIRDGISDALGIDDGDARISWEYSQRYSQNVGVDVTITVMD